MAKFMFVAVFAALVAISVAVPRPDNYGASGGIHGGGHGGVHGGGSHGLRAPVVRHEHGGVHAPAESRSLGHGGNVRDHKNWRSGHGGGHDGHGGHGGYDRGHNTRY
ncbi:holotricin-3-like isoform X2 [Phlebotomus papatasi]|uniref:holotricin-3-like isoform X2 n=1 Tax=Phlebotomus papatasi TaxID=29031 RepID=UPI00248402E9|nr:holotricin-3-like isoform X2 [Phlebotomus papatasi]